MHLGLKGLWDGNRRVLCIELFGCRRSRSGLLASYPKRNEI